MRGTYTDVITYPLQKFPGGISRATDIFGRILLQCAIIESLDTAILLYGTLTLDEKQNMSANRMLCQLITGMNHGNIEKVCHLTALIINDRDLEWSAQSHSPYIASLSRYIETLHLLEQDEDPLNSSIQGRQKEMIAAIKLLHQLNDGFVPLRHCDLHGSTVVSSLFRYAPLDLLEAVYRSLDDRREQRGEIAICSSVDLDGETASDIAARRGPAFQNIAMSWHEDDSEPPVLQSVLDQKDFRQAAELLFVQKRFKEAMEYLCKIETERSDWILCTMARTYFCLQQYWRAHTALDGVGETSSTLHLRSRIAWELGNKLTAIQLNRAAYARENPCDVDVSLQRELLTYLLPGVFSKFPPVIQNMIVEPSIDCSRGMSLEIPEGESSDWWTLGI